MVELDIGDTLKFENFEIETVPAYNVVKTDCHPKENLWLGYVIKYQERSLYYTSDTELIPEMEKITADIIFLPLGQVYTMNSVAQAVEVINLVGAKIAVPIHYGKYEGTLEDVETLKTLVGSEVEVYVI